MSIFSEKQRGVIKKITIEIEYPNGARKTRAYNPQRDNIEGIVWSDNMVNEVLAPYYEKRQTVLDTFQVMEMWDPLYKDWDERPTMLLKGINDWVVPSCSMQKDTDTIEEMIMLGKK